MHFKFRHLEKIVGGFFILTCIIVMILVVIVARGQRWFQQYTPYVCYLPDGGGLTTGSNITINSLEAGRAVSLTLNKDNNVRVDIEIFKQYEDRITEGSLVKLSSPLVGASSLEIILGKKDGKPIPSNSVIPTKESSGEGLDGLIEYATNLLKTLENPKGDLMQTLEHLNHATKDLSNALVKLEEQELYENLNSSIKHLDGILSSVDEKSPELSDAVTEARKALEETNKVMLALQKSFLLRGKIKKYLAEDSNLLIEGRAE